VRALRGAAVRAEVRIEEVPAPRRTASHAFALSASVLAGEEEPADGRLVLLFEPDGHPAWQGRFRLVTLARADLEPEMAADPLLPEVAWSWLSDALTQRGAEQGQPSGSVTLSGTQHFGGIADRPSSTSIELRASWTPADERLGRHLAAWCDLLCACAGLPPDPGGPGVRWNDAGREAATDTGNGPGPGPGGPGPQGGPAAPPRAAGPAANGQRATAVPQAPADAPATDAVPGARADRPGAASAPDRPAADAEARVVPLPLRDRGARRRGAETPAAERAHHGR